MRFDQYAGHCIVSNFRLHRDSHSQILIATETQSAPTLARSNLIRLSSLDWPGHGFSYLLHQHRSVTSMQIIQFPCISWIGIGENYAVQSLTFCLYLLLAPTDSWHLLLLKLGFSTKLHFTAYTSLACVAFATILHFQTLATCQATTWLVVTRPAAGHPLSVLSQAFHQSNFAILAIYPHTIAGCVLWSGPATQLFFRIHLPYFVVFYGRYTQWNIFLWLVDSWFESILACQAHKVQDMWLKSMITSL